MYLPEILDLFDGFEEVGEVFVSNDGDLGFIKASVDSETIVEFDSIVDADKSDMLLFKASIGVGVGIGVAVVDVRATNVVGGSTQRK
ncbi:2638_t:CDS:2 [Entrophospora sp. SA101]|nr:2638_t:CDS:2 [Entrophospora sp. SA101]